MRMTVVSQEELRIRALPKGMVENLWDFGEFGWTRDQVGVTKTASGVPLRGLVESTDFRVPSTTFS